MLGAGVVLSRFAMMGGGDSKLLVALAAWTGTSGLPSLLVAVSIAGGLLAVVMLAVRGAAVRLAPAAHWPRVLHSEAPLPYAVAIAAGAAVWRLSSVG